MRHLPLADDLYCIAHSDVTGQTRAHPRSIALGLGATLLGELVLESKVLTDNHGNVVRINYAPPRDALAHAVMDQIAKEQPHPVRTWVEYLALTATDRVAERLAQGGHLRQVEQRGIFKTTYRWVPVDMSFAATPGGLLRHQLQNEQELTLSDVALLGLVDAIGMTPAVLWGVSSRTMQLRDWYVAQLPSVFRELIAETKAAAGDAVLSRRT